MKKIYLLILILLICGCSANYNLEIKEDSFYEKIDVIINKSDIPDSNQTIDGIELSDQITPFLQSQNSVFFTNPSIKYNKKIEEISDYYSVIMDYEYKPSEFKDSNTLNMCFSDFEFNEEDNYYIHAYGTFYCLYTDNIDINIKTNNKVLKNNADSVKGNVYTWNINTKNNNSVDIEFEITKTVSHTNIIIYVVLFIIVVVAVVVAANLYIKKKKKDIL